VLGLRLSDDSSALGAGVGVLPEAQMTRQLKIQEQKRQQMMAYAQPEEEISLETSVLTWCRQLGQLTI